MAKKLEKAQVGKIVKSAGKTISKAMNSKVIPKGLPATVGSLGAAGYVASKVYGKKSDTTPKKKMGGSKPLTKAQNGAVMLSITDPKQRMNMAIGDSTRAAKQIELANKSAKLKRKQKKEIQELNEPRLHSPAIERYTQKMEKLNSKK